jgi:hypothetical protein
MYFRKPVLQFLEAGIPPPSQQLHPMPYIFVRQGNCF